MVKNFVECVAYANDWVAMHKNVLITKNIETLLLNLPTSLQEPLMIRHKTRHVKLPKLPTGVTITIDDCSCETVGDLCNLLNMCTGVKYTVGFPNDPYGLKAWEN